MEGGEGVECAFTASQVGIKREGRVRGGKCLFFVCSTAYG